MTVETRQFLYDTRMNESSNISEYCKWYFDAGNAIRIPHYTVTSMYVTFGILRHMVCLIVFYRQSKKDPGCMYQVFIAISETGEIFTVLLYTASLFWLSGIEGTGGVEWYRSCYGCMWISAHVSTPLLHVFLTITAALSVAVAIDRVYAIAWPFKYKTAKHRRHQVFALSIAAILGVSTSIFDCFRYSIVSDGKSYKGELNAVFINSTIAKALAETRNILRAICLLVLVCANAALVRLYRVKVVRVGEALGGSEEKRKEIEKNLLVFTISESVFKSIATLLLSSYYMAVYIIPTFAACQSHFYVRLLDITVQLCELLDFYIVFGLSRKFRRMILSSVIRWSAGS